MMPDLSTCKIFYALEGCRWYYSQVVDEWLIVLDTQQGSRNVGMDVSVY